MKPLPVFFIMCYFPAVGLLAATAPSPPSHSLATPNISDIRDIKEIIPLTNGNPLWYWFGGGIFLLLLLTVLFLYLKINRRPKKQPGLQAHEKALTALKSVRSLMTPEQSRVFAIAMADTLRQYIEERFQLAVYNQTTREFLCNLMATPGGIPASLEHHEEMLRDWMNHCDLVKFARYRLTAHEMEQMYSSVTDFIAATQPGDVQQ